MHRREFLKRAAQSAAAAATLARAGVTAGQEARQSPPSERIRIAMIGVAGMGRHLTKGFASLPEVEVAYICDIDSRVIPAAVEEVASRQRTEPRVVGDFRRILDDGGVDAVVMATPDHWHGPATILACEAGKHVYVEKPCAHNIREGRLMIEAARRHQRVVQVGTQSRSIAGLRQAMKLLHDGAIGEVLVAKAWNSQLRGSIGRGSPSEPPAGVDYDMWLGPAPFVPFQSNRFHSHWRWWYAFGTGDIGNDGVHDIDIARWGLGVEEHPATITAVGAKLFHDDDQEFPDTQTVIYEYPAAASSSAPSRGPAEDSRPLRAKQLIFEQRIWSPYVQEGHENGNAFYGTQGMMILGKKDGFKLYGPRNELREEVSWTFDSRPHHQDFVNAIKSGRHPNADVEIGHLSSALSHLGNIAARVGRVLHLDVKTEQIRDDVEANTLVRRAYRDGYWAVPKGV